MTTTIMKDSIVGDAWIGLAAQSCPIQRVLGADGQPNGDILTGPVRLAFTQTLWELDAKDADSKYSACLQFTPYADQTILYEEYYEGLAQNFAANWNATTKAYNGVHSPFHDGQEKYGQYEGFTPGCLFMTCGSQYKPPIVDNRNNPIVDKNRIYPGVWAICSIKRYPYGLGANVKPGSKKGIGFGLQSVMLIGDDNRFGAGGPPDTSKTFAGVGMIAAPPTSAGQAQGMPQGGAPAPAAGIPGYTTHGGGVPQGGPAPFQPPQPQQQQQFQTPVQQQQYQAPQQQPMQQQYQAPQQQQQFQPPMQQQQQYQAPAAPGFHQPGAPTAQGAAGQPYQAPGFVPPANS